MRCARLGFPRALQIFGSHQGKCRFETPALPQRPGIFVVIFLVQHVTNTHTQRRIIISKLL
jgi:hypothetical protein